MDPDENRRLVIEAIERFNAGDVAGYLRSYADDAVIHGLPAEADCGGGC
jgi:hypothetical protein